MSSGATAERDTITVAVRLFAELRERAGAGRLEVRVAADACASDVWAALPEVLSRSPRPHGLAYAVNDAWADALAPLHDGAEVALVLPGSGG